MMCNVSLKLLGNGRKTLEKKKYGLYPFSFSFNSFFYLGQKRKFYFIFVLMM